MGEGEEGEERLVMVVEKRRYGRRAWRIRKIEPGVERRMCDSRRMSLPSLPSLRISFQTLEEGFRWFSVEGRPVSSSSTALLP